MMPGRSCDCGQAGGGESSLARRAFTYCARLANYYCSSHCLRNSSGPSVLLPGRRATIARSSGARSASCFHCSRAVRANLDDHRNSLSCGQATATTTRKRSRPASGEERAAKSTIECRLATAAEQQPEEQQKQQQHGKSIGLSVAGQQRRGRRAARVATRISIILFLLALLAASPGGAQIQPGPHLAGPKGRGERAAEDQNEAPPKGGDSTRVVAVAGQTIEFQCPLGGELLPQTSSAGGGHLSGSGGGGGNSADERTIIWRKDGQPLSQMNSTRVRLSQAANSSSLTIVQAQSRLDEANYECALVNVNGEPGKHKAEGEKSHQFKLRLLVPPRLAPFEFPADAQVGMKVLLTCSALEGQQPISFVWLRDNQIIEPAGQPAGKVAGPSSPSVASLAQVHQQQLADKFALSAHSAISLGQKSAYVLIGGGVGGVGGTSSSLDEDLLGPDGPDTPPRDPSGRDRGKNHQARSSTTNNNKTQPMPSMQLSDSSIRIRQADDYSILSIEPLELKHSGRYTCSAQNEAARVSHSSQLSINAPPTFTIEPRDGSLVSGQSIVLECAASGQPRPALSWLRARESNGGKQWDFVPIYENLRYTILLNGSLAINNVTQREQGFYMCSAKNGFGPEVTKLIKITVHEPARISTKYKLVEARIEERALMTCVASGEPPLSLTWFDKEGKQIEKTDKRFILDHENSFAKSTLPAAAGDSSSQPLASNNNIVKPHVPDLLANNQSESSLIIARATRSDSGHYTCQASNKHGQDKMVINLLVQDVPDKVADLKVTNVTAATISLRWQLGFTGNSPVTSYLVQYQSDDPLDDLLMSVARNNLGGSPSTAPSGVSSQTGADTATGLAPTTTAATTSERTNGGFSRLYNHLFGQSDQNKQDQDKQLTTSGQQTNSIKAALEALNSLGSSLGDLSITTADEAIDRTLVELTVEQTATNLIIKDLSPYCVYRLRLAGINKIGLGEFSDWIRAKTEEAPPTGSALKIFAAATGPNSIKLTWLPPDRRSWNGQLVRFQIGYRPIDSTFELNKSVEWSPPTLMQSILIDADSKKRSQTDSPEKQRNGDNASKGDDERGTNNSISTPKSLLGEDASSPYALRQHLRQLLALQQRELVAHLTNLQRSTTYLVWIQAVNSRGPGPQSHAISVKTLDDVPPSAPALRIQSTTTNSIAISWSMLSNFVSPANHYSLFYRRVPPPSIATNPSQQHYYPAARQGPSNFSGHHSLMPSDNSAPIFNEPGPFIERTITSQQLLHSSAMSQQGQFFASDNSDFDTMSAAHKQPSNPFLSHQQQQALQQQHYQQFVYSLDQLECGSIYELYMTTRNSVGKSEPSAVVTTRTLGEPPLAPHNKNSLFAKIGAQDVLLNLASWSTGGCPLTHVSVRYKQLPQPVAAATISHADPTLSNSSLASSIAKLPSFSVTWPVSTSVPSNLLQAINKQQDASGRLQQQQQQHHGPQVRLVASGDNELDQTSEGAAHFPIKNLQPSTGYELEIVAHNAAGHTTAQYEFVTAGLNGSRSGYTRREGVYRLDQRGQPIESGEQQLPSSAFTNDGNLGGHLPGSPPNLAQGQPTAVQQIVALAFTLLCFACLVITTTFCYYKFTSTNWKHQSRRASMDGMQSVCSGSAGGGGGGGDLHARPVIQSWSRHHHDKGSASSSSRFLKDQARHSELIEHDQTPSSINTSDSQPEDQHLYCMREHPHLACDSLARQQQQQLISATLNPKSSASFSQSVSMKDFNLIPPLGSAAAATLNFKNARNQMVVPQQQSQQRLSGGVLLRDSSRPIGAATTMGRTRLSEVQTSTNPVAYGNVNGGASYGQTLGPFNKHKQEFIYNQHATEGAYGSNGFATNHIFPPGSGGDSNPQSLETSWTTASGGMQHNSLTNYAIPATYQQQHIEQPHQDQSQLPYGCDDVYGQGTIDACIQHLMNQQYQEHQAAVRQQYSSIVHQKQQIPDPTVGSTSQSRCLNIYGAEDNNADHSFQEQTNSTGDQSGQQSFEQQPQSLPNGGSSQVQLQQQRPNNYSMNGLAGPAQSVIESSGGSSSSGIGVESSSGAASQNLDCGSSITTTSTTNQSGPCANQTYAHQVSNEPQQSQHQVSMNHA